MSNKEIFEKLKLPAEVKKILAAAPKVTLAATVEELSVLSVRDMKDNLHPVSYEAAGKGMVLEAEVCRVKNGICANYPDPYMRRRDPDSMLIGDEYQTDKAKYKTVHGESFEAAGGLRDQTIDWLTKQNLAVFFFRSGRIEAGIPSIVICPDNAGFFALGLAELQGIIPADKIGNDFDVKCVLYVAPPFRHTHFGGKQRVVHRRTEDSIEIFSYNLYPGPSAKKGVYGTLLHFGEKEGWLTNHASVVQVVTPYDNRVTLMHEGASGGGKSEMNEHVHREFDGTIHFGTNVVTQDKRYIVIPRGCNLHPVTDDMAIAHPSLQKNNGKLQVADAESAWFIRVDHIKEYGTDPDIEARSVHPDKPLLFLNIDARPDSTALLWEHVEDAPGKTCPNPRFILPRHTVPDVVDRSVGVDIRSFGVRTPPCTKEKPTYGILGIFHVMPPALAWLWRLAAPRGHDNPSITSSEGMHSEGVGTFWPFATGLRVRHADLLLDQILQNEKTHYVLTPCKHVGAWKTGFTPQWVMREYLARRGGVRFMKGELTAARCSLLGYSLNRLVVEGQHFDIGMLQVEKQAEVGEQAYDSGAQVLKKFFEGELKNYLSGGLSKKGSEIIKCCLDGGSVSDYEKLVSAEAIFMED